MIKDKQMRYIKSEDGYDYYIFTPTLNRQYFNRTEHWTVHRKNFSHKLHMFLYMIRGGYNILYMMNGDDIAAYVIYARCGATVIKGTSRDDIFTVFVTTNPEYRRRGIATKIIFQLLHGVGINYRTSYKTIVDTNIGSIKAAVNNDYKVLYCAKRSPLLKTISESNTGDWRLYSVSR